jgi:nitrite reductase/ring-hydroxylating ferredoxin subunit
LQAEIERALAEAVPDLSGVEVEGMAEQLEATAKAAALLGSVIKPRDDTAQPAKLVQIKRPQPAAGEGAVWVPVVRSLGFDEGKFTLVRHAEIDVLVCKIGGEFRAYRNACVEGGRAMDDALFETPMLTCSCHGHSYDLRRGHCVEKPELRLASLPAKVEDDKVKVALPRGE